MFIQLVLQSYAVISLVKYSCMFAPIICNKLCNKFVQWRQVYVSLSPVFLMRPCSVFTHNITRSVKTIWVLLPHSYLASIACSTEAVESWGKGEGVKRDWKYFLFRPKMHTKLTHSHHRRAETMEEYYQQYVQLLPASSPALQSLDWRGREELGISAMQHFTWLSVPS